MFKETRLIYFLLLLLNNTFPFQWRVVKNTAFQLGEELHFKIIFGIIHAGETNIKIDKSYHKVNNRDAYYISVKTISYPFFDIFYKVRNHDETWIDTTSICSLMYRKKYREAGYSRDETVIIDHENNFYTILDTSKTYNVTPFAQDSISALYYFRTLEIDCGKEYLVDVISGDKLIPIKVMVEKIEKINTLFGEKECFVIEPKVIENVAPFRAKGRLWIYLTKDERKIPVRMKSKILLGSIIAELTSYREKIN